MGSEGTLCAVGLKVRSWHKQERKDWGLPPLVRRRVFVFRFDGGFVEIEQRLVGLVLARFGALVFAAAGLEHVDARAGVEQARGLELVEAGQIAALFPLGSVHGIPA